MDARLITNKYKRNLIKRIANTNHVHDFFKFPLSRKTNKYLEHEYPSRIQLQTLTRSIHEISLEKLEGREHPPGAHPPYIPTCTPYFLPAHFRERGNESAVVRIVPCIWISDAVNGRRRERKRRGRKGR